MLYVPSKPRSTQGFRSTSSLTAKILSYMEFSQYAAVVMAGILGFGDLSLAKAAAVRDKRAMKQLLKQARVPVVTS